MWRYLIQLTAGALLLAALPLWAGDLQKADVLKITDGDTVLLVVGTEEIKLRLLEIDCFESKRNNRVLWQAETYGLSEEEVLLKGAHSAAVLEQLWRDYRDFFYVRLKGKGAYRRHLGTLYIIRENRVLNVNRYMLQFGGCVPYQPKPRGWQVKKKNA